MQNVPACLQHGGEIRHKLIHIDLGGLGFGACGHGGIELVEGHGLAQIVGILDAVQLIVEADVADIPGFKMCPAQIRRGAAGENVLHIGSSVSPKEGQYFIT